MTAPVLYPEWPEIGYRVVSDVTLSHGVKAYEPSDDEVCIRGMTTINGKPCACVMVIPRHALQDGQPDGSTNRAMIKAFKEAKQDME